MDAEKLKNRLFEKTGKKIDVDDPLFTAMLLNQIVLEEYVENIAQVIEKTGTNIELNTGALLAGSKAVIAETSKLATEADRLHDAAAAKAAENTKNTITDEAARLVTEAAHSAMQNVLDDAAAKLSNATNAYTQACLAVRAEADAVKKAVKLDMVALACAGVMIGAIGGAIGGYVGRWSVDPEIVVDPETAQLGRDFKNLYQYLDRDTADKVQRALDSLHAR